jgi:hypothetical protein
MSWVLLATKSCSPSSRNSWATPSPPRSPTSTDPTVAAQLIADYRPQTVVLNAGATPPGRIAAGADLGDVQHQLERGCPTRLQLHPRGPDGAPRPRVGGVSLSSGAALAGSPLSGGYAGAKATIKLISSYAIGLWYSPGPLSDRRLGARGDPQMRFCVSVGTLASAAMD